MKYKLTSNNFITGTGLKKWRPPNLSFRLVTEAISPILNEEVFEAKTVCFGATYVIKNIWINTWIINKVFWIFINMKNIMIKTKKCTTAMIGTIKIININILVSLNINFQKYLFVIMC